MTDSQARRESYLAFLKAKIPQAERAGFEPPSDPHPSLRGDQRDVCAWAIQGGRRAIFAAFGLGKTRMQIQIAKWVTEQTGGRYLIVAPLGVRQEFTLSDGPAMGVPIKYVRDNAEVIAAPENVLITNYDRVRDGDLDVSQFDGAGLDESSVLRSYGSKTYQAFLGLFKPVKYRWVFTATPSPNRYKELIHYAGFLGVMDTGDALTRFFKRDSSQANNLTLMPSMEAQFWLWLASWACFIQRPSDLGYSDEGFDLPPMQVHWHKVEVDNKEAWSQTDSWGQRQLFMDQSQGLAQSAKGKRNSIQLRIDRGLEIMAQHSDGRHWLLWHDLEAERHEIERRVPGVVTAYGSQDLDEREQVIQDFAHGRIPLLASKPSICGSGTNLQRHCADAIFLGVNYKLNDFLQSIHRLFRYQQKRQVNIHIIYLDSESIIVQTLKEKWRRHEELMLKMSEILRQHQLTNPLAALTL